MDKWFKDILPDKDPYHNRGRDQMGTNLIWKFADQKVNGFGPVHIEKSYYKGIFGCI
jgi:hypothetical protein